MVKKVRRYVMTGLLVAAVALTAAPAVAAESEAQSETAAESTAQSETAAESTSDDADFNESEAESEIQALVDLDALKAARDENGLKADDWLPIGSVVLLDGANKTLMVMSRFAYNNEDGKYYEYCGCLYPEGFGDSQYYFFNHDNIALIAQRGYEDEYEKLYRSMVLDGLDISLLNTEDETETE